MKSFWLAWQFLTRFPAPTYAEVSAREMGCSQLWYPLVGLILGALLYGAAWLLAQTTLPPLAVAALLLVLWVVMTGALHLDGVADTADAWVGGLGNLERSLEIMKDPRSGAMGVTALVLVLLVKFSLLSAWPQGLPPVVLLVPALARAAVTPLFLSLPYLRAEGLARAFVDHLPLTAFLLIWLPLLGVAGYLLGFVVLWLSLALLMGLLALIILFKRRFGGLTGDLVGAAIEILECVLLMALVLTR